jgi:hypothetical protein
MSASKLILRSVSFARSSLPKVSSGARTRGALGTETLHKIQCRQFRASIKFQSTPFSPLRRVIASLLQAGELLRRSVEPTQTPRAPLLRIFSARRGQLRLLISNSFGALKALRSLLSDALVQFLQEPTSRVFHTFSLSPALSRVPVVHGSNHAAEGLTRSWEKHPQIRIVSRCQI